MGDEYKKMPSKEAEPESKKADDPKLTATKKTKAKPIPNNKVVSSGHYFAGDKAVAKVEELEGRSLTEKEKAIVGHEGYVDVPYLDSKGIVTAGVGQTGEFIDKPFSKAVETKERLVSGIINNYEDLPEYLQGEFLQTSYRGIVKSHKWIKLFNNGQPREAAKEFLNNKEFKETSRTGIRARFQSMHDAMIRYADDKDSQRSRHQAPSYASLIPKATKT